MIDYSLLEWKTGNADYEQYKKPYINGIGLNFCFHFKINLDFFTKHEFVKVHPISAEDFISVILYFNKMQYKFWNYTKAENINTWISNLNSIRKSTLRNILIYNDIRITNDGLIVPIADADNPCMYNNGALQTIILGTTLWKKFYKCHKKQIDDGIYEKFEKEEE
ncbi:MAG: hypothetical protein J6J11_03755 [Treponema sp.]|nr:hypothetical protein [Clostridia bacterium]MBP3607413.1 hypothetical protein [Treponema sp.]